MIFKGVLAWDWPYCFGGGCARPSLSPALYCGGFCRSDAANHRGRALNGAGWYTLRSGPGGLTIFPWRCFIRCG